MAPPYRANSSPDEGIILLAASAFHSGEIKSVSAAAKAYNAHKSTLYKKIKGQTPREGYRPKKHSSFSYRREGASSRYTPA